MLLNDRVYVLAVRVCYIRLSVGLRLRSNPMHYLPVFSAPWRDVVSVVERTSPKLHQLRPLLPSVSLKKGRDLTNSIHTLCGCA